MVPPLRNDARASYQILKRFNQGNRWRLIRWRSALLNDSIDHQDLMAGTRCVGIERDAGLKVIDEIVSAANIPDKCDSVATIAHFRLGSCLCRAQHQKCFAVLRHHLECFERKPVVRTNNLQILVKTGSR